MDNRFSKSADEKYQKLLARAAKASPKEKAVIAKAIYDLVNPYSQTPAKDEKKKNEYMEKAAELGYPAALYQVGLHYLRGDSDYKEDYGKAREHFAKAAKLRYGPAIQQLAAKKLDYEREYKKLESDADNPKAKDSVKAKYELAMILQEERALREQYYVLSYDEQGEKKEKKAAKYFYDAVKAEHPEALLENAYRLEREGLAAVRRAEQRLAEYHSYDPQAWINNSDAAAECFSAAQDHFNTALEKYEQALKNYEKALEQNKNASFDMRPEINQRMPKVYLMLGMAKDGLPRKDGSFEFKRTKSGVEEAKEYYKKSADLGDPVALCYHMGYVADRAAAADRDLDAMKELSRVTSAEPFKNHPTIILRMVKALFNSPLKLRAYHFAYQAREHAAIRESLEKRLAIDDSREGKGQAKEALEDAYFMRTRKMMAEMLAPHEEELRGSTKGSALLDLLTSDLKGPQAMKDCQRKLFGFMQFMQDDDPALAKQPEMKAALAEMKRVVVSDFSPKSTMVTPFFSAKAVVRGERVPPPPSPTTPRSRSGN